MLGLLLAGWVAATPQPDPPVVEWHWSRLPGAESCPGGGALGRRIVDRLGRDPLARGRTPDLILEGVVDRRPNGWRARLFVRGPQGEARGARVLETESDDCGALTDAVVLAAVLSIDPEALTRPPSPPAAKTSTATAATRTATIVRYESVRVVLPAISRGGVAASVGAAFNVGTLPQATAGVGLDVEVPIGERWRAGAGFGLWVAQRTGPVDAGLAAGWLQGCWVALGGDSFTVGGCLRLYAGALRVAIVGDPERERLGPGQYPWLSIAPTVRASWSAVGPLRLALDLAGPVSLTRQAFEVDGRLVFQESPVALNVSFLVGLAI